MKLKWSVAFLLFGLISIAQSSYRFKNYTIADGLSQSSVSTIIQDKYGALWLGTQDGLNRFDGQSFENFLSDNTKGIENSYIHTSLKDKKGNLWFGTANGLTKYNPTLENFQSYQLKSGYALQVETITQDEKGNLWLGTSSNGLCVFSPKNLEIKFFASQIPSDKIINIQFVSKDDLLVSTEDKGVFCVNIQSKKVTQIEVLGKQKTFVRVNSFIKFGSNSYLFGSNQGLYKFNISTRKVEPFLTELDKNYGQVEVSDIYIENENQFFVGTKSHGLLTVYIQNKRIKIDQNTQDIFQKNALLYNAINKIYKDKNNTFWVATERGVSSFNPYVKGFLSVEPSGDLSKGIPSPNVWCFAEDQSANYLFVGTDQAVSRKNRKTGKFDQFLRNKKATLENNESSILSLLPINANHILVGTTEGLYQLLIKSPYDYHFQKVNYKGIANPSNFDRTYRILHWKEQLYFLSTKGGVLLYNQKNGNFQAFEHQPLESKNTIQPGFCKFVFKDDNGKIWFTTTVGGLNYLKEDKDGIKIVPYLYNDVITKVSKDYITNICQTDPQTFWLGTLGSGVIKYNINTHKIENFTKQHGLPNNVVYGILKDEANSIWLSTNKGISRISLINNSITNFSEIDGLVSTEFNLGAYVKSKIDLLYFGTINGYNYFNPNQLNKKNKRTRVVFTKFKTDKHWLKPNGDDHILSKSISETNRIELNYKQRSFTIKFMAFDLSNPNLVNYKYILEGSEEGEIQIGNSNQIHFNALQPGEYILKVYAKVGNGDWSNYPAELQIAIDAPFWKTTVFWIICILIVGVIVLIVTRSRIEQERRQQVRLEMKIAERTREIREQNIKIEKQKQTIEEKKNHLEEQKHLLEIEKEKTERLLKNIIPESTMQELRTKGKASARAYKTVSVMFTDFVGFTKIAERMSPSDLVSELDIYFRKFDEIIINNNLEKIKTIGDAYMCAGGVPVRNNTNPIDACLAALQIQEAMKQFRKEAETSGKEIWDLRLGINTGEVTAGVIGSEKLAYDIWGATVNQAQRMEMLGEPGKVTISGQTFQYIEPYFVCTFKGKVKSKSKGLIDMYTVDSIKPGLSVNGEGIIPNERFKEIFNLHHYSSINYYKAEKYIMKILEKKLSPKLHYHSIAHTKDVCKAVERLALLEGVTDEGLFLLKSAATYHDAGFVESYEKNEPVGARMAGEILPKFGYTEEHIEQIRKLIYVTQIPHKPTNKLEEIICDADLDYLGTDEFHVISDKLRLELREHGKIDSDRKWDEIQVMFLNNHQYFTETAKATRQAKKMKHLEEIKERLLRNEYVD
jgi:ligand-binding sensor domain-containing protein/class 3 adenylate cyclase/predicted metal-dependent HD superfamily phosphohydrolase